MLQRVATHRNSVANIYVSLKSYDRLAGANFLSVKFVSVNKQAFRKKIERHNFLFSFSNFRFGFHAFQLIRS